MKLHGEVAPDGQDGYAPGAWDEVRRAFMDGHISEEAYDVLRAAIGAERPSRGTGTCPIRGHDHDLRRVASYGGPATELGEVLWECPAGGGRFLEVPR